MCQEVEFEQEKGNSMEASLICWFESVRHGVSGTQVY